MDSFRLYKYESDKPYLKVRLDISGRIINWLVPKTSPLKKSVKRLAFELPDTKSVKEAARPVMITKSDIKIKYLSKRKIIFKLIRTKLEIDEFVLLIPSWGLRTKNKIWVLIPV